MPIDAWQICPNNFFFRTEAYWTVWQKPNEQGIRKKSPPFEKSKITLVGEAPPYEDYANDFEKAKATLGELISQIEDKSKRTEGGFAGTGIRIRHGIFAVGTFSLYFYSYFQAINVEKR